MVWVGETPHVVFVGAPLQESETLPVNPVSGVMVNVYVPECEREIVSDAGEAEIEKSATFCVSPADELPWKLELVETKVTVTVWLPILKLLIENWAVPADRAEEPAGVELPSK
jgi:hypothetical protein